MIFLFFFYFSAATSSGFHLGLGAKTVPGCLAQLVCKLMLRVGGMDILGCFDIVVGVEVGKWTLGMGAIASGSSVTARTPRAHVCCIS